MDIKSTETSLFETNQIFELLVNAVNDYAIFFIDTEGYIKTWNMGGKRLKGYTSEEIIGKNFSIFYTEADKKRNHPQSELKLAKENGKYEEEGWRLRKDGSVFWASVVITSLNDKSGIHRGFAKVTRDLSNKKIAEDNLKNAYDNLEKRVEERTRELALAKEAADKAVRARDEFLSIASHELNTPLTSLKLQTQMRRRQITKITKNDNNEISQAALDRMFHNDEKQINRLARLVDDMLDISRLNSGKFTYDKSEANLNKIVSDVISRFSAHSETLKIPIYFESKAKVEGFWDHYRIDQVITNLVSNAFKYGDNKPITIVVDSDQGNALISVTDRGVGIPKDDQLRIFQQYERAVSASTASGLGLGLYIVNQILLGHNGHISVTSEVNQGSTFKITLPLGISR